MTVRTAYPATESNGDTLTTTNFDKLPGGWIGYAEITSNSGLTGITAKTIVTGLSVTVTVNTSRRIQVTGSVGYTLQGAAGRAKGYITESGSTLKTFINNTGALSDEGQGEGSVVLTPSAGAHTYEIDLSVVGSGTIDVTAGATDPGPCFVLVTDIGPA